ncbi:MAG: NAD(P)-dependent oxidoreductase [Gemmataceae bacterium]|nr:NAD(P)-dependent oxidoreductase [Gemmataceae bacterium]
MAPTHMVLVTGSAGRVGRAVVKDLQARGLAVRGFDRVPSPGLEDTVQGDLTDPAALARAWAGVRTLVHLAATPDDADFMTELLPNNLIGVYNVFEAARQAGVRRLVVASSGQVAWYQRFNGPLPIRVTDPVTPRAWYAAAKVFLEAAGRAYVEAHGMSVIAARLGWCPRTPAQAEQLAGLDWGKDVYLSPGDAGRFFACAVQAPEELRFAVVYAASKPLHTGYYDLAETRRLLGYEPQESWPDGVDIILGTA